MQSPLLRHQSSAPRARRLLTKEERHLLRSGRRRRQHVEKPFLPLLPMLEAAQLPSKANRVEVVAGKVATPANHGLLCRPPEQVSLQLATSANNARVGHLNKKSQPLLQLAA